MLFLEIAKEQVKLPTADGVRKFELQQQTIRGSALFLKRLDEAVQVEKAGLGDLTMEAVVDAAASQIEAIIVDLLHPSDGGPRLTMEQAADLRTDQRTAILEAQIKLDRADELVPPAMAIVMEIQATRLAIATIGLAAGTRSWGPLGLQDTTQSEWPLSGPLERPCTSTEPLSETDGGVENS